MSGKVCKYVAAKILNANDKPVQDRFRQEIGSYFEIDNNESLVFRDYLENRNRCSNK